jgi:hypothetical protein
MYFSNLIKLIYTWSCLSTVNTITAIVGGILSILFAIAVCVDIYRWGREKYLMIRSAIIILIENWNKRNDF